MFQLEIIRKIVDQLKVFEEDNQRFLRPAVVISAVELKYIISWNYTLLKQRLPIYLDVLLRRLEGAHNSMD